MEKSSNPLSVAGCIFMCYKAASPLNCIAFIISCIVLSWIITLQDFYSSFSYLFQTTFQLLSSAWKCCNNQVKIAAPTEATLETCTKECDKNESLLREDLELVMEKIGIFLDPINDGKLQENIGSREISALFNEAEPSLEEVKEAFDLFDENGDGYIDAKELKKIISNFGFTEASEDECQRMINTFDDDRDGRINLGEFVKLMGDSFSS